MDINNLSDVISNLSGDDVERLRSLASSLLESNTGGGENVVPTSNPDFSNSDMEMLLKAKKIMEKMNTADSKDAKLIAALKPYLNEQKQQKADQSIRLLRLLEVFPYIKELF